MKDFKLVYSSLVITSIALHAVALLLILRELKGVDHEQGETLYRILQETLTNAYRHGQSTFVDVTMKWRAEKPSFITITTPSRLPLTRIYRV